MKAQFLKIAGVKTEAAFYKKYKTEKDFFSAHPEAKKLIKKAQAGTITLNDNQLGDSTSGYAFPGGPNNNNVLSSISPSMITGAMQGIKGIADSFNSNRRRKKELQQENQLLGVTERLSNTPDVNLPLQKQVLDSPENYIASTNMFYPSQGTGYNILNAVGRDGLNIRKAQEGFVEDMGMDSAGYDYYEGAPEPVNIQEMQAITEAQPDPNQMSDQEAASFMETYNRDQGKSTETFDSGSARDTWVHKTGLPWSEAKRLGYTDGSTKDNTKLLNELKDPRFNKENIRTAPPKKSSPTRTPVQHRETPTGKLAPIKPVKLKEYKGPEFRQDSKSSYERQLESKRKTAEFDDELYGERILTYLANPSKLVGDIRSVLNPMFTTDDETSEADRKEVMANRYNPNLTKAQKLKNKTVMGLKKTPEAAATLATIMAMSPYTTYQQFPIGLPQAAVRRAGFLGQGAKQLGQAAPKMLNPATPKMLTQPFTPNFVMYQQGGEIQNTYAPNNLYDDLGYEPLQVKQYAFGGHVEMAQNGYSENDDDTLWNATSTGKNKNLSSSVLSGVNSLIGSQFNNNPGYQTGNLLGGFSDLIAPGSSAFVAPALGLVGGAVEDMFGDSGKIKSLQRMNQHKQNSIIRNSMYKNLGTSPFRQEGGWVSNDWQPQVITKFGDHTAEDVYDFAHEGMDSLRSGGHLKDGRYTPVNSRGLETYDMGGNVNAYNLGETEVESGGYLDPISYNPYNDGTGWTSEIKGQYHDDYDSKLGHSGVIINHGDNKVEAERGELIRHVQEGDSVDGNDLSANITGNLKYNSIFGDEDPKYKKYEKMKIKNIHKDIANKDKKLNNKQKQIINQIADLNSDPHADPLKKITLKAMEDGINQQYAINSEAANYFTNHQDKVNNLVDSLSKLHNKEFSHENFAEKGILTDKLAKGEISQGVAKSGKKIYKAQTGYTSKYGLDPWEGNVSPGNKYGKQTASSYSAEEWDKIADELGYGSEFEKFKKDNPNATAYDYNKYFQEFLMKNPESLKLIKERHNALYGKEPEAEGKLGFGFSAAGLKYLKGAQKAAPEATPAAKTDKEYIPIEQEKKGFPWGSVIANTLRMFEKPFNMPLDSSQIASELRDLADNRPEGIYEPHIYSMLETPYTYSADADRNAIMSQARAATRMAGNNPAAQAAIMAQVSQAMNQIGSKEAEVNQQTQQGVYNRNIGTVNADRVRNAAIDLDAMNKYAAAVKATRDTEREALRSIGDKKAQNKAENMQYNITQAMYPDYTFNSSGQLIKRPRYIEFDTTGSGASSKGGGGGLAPGYEYTYDANGNIIGTRKSSKADEDIARNGKSIKKKNLNSSIVKAFKNL